MDKEMRLFYALCLKKLTRQALPLRSRSAMICAIQAVRYTMKELWGLRGMEYIESILESGTPIRVDVQHDSDYVATQHSVLLNPDIVEMLSENNYEDIQPNQ